MQARNRTAQEALKSWLSKENSLTARFKPIITESDNIQKNVHHISELSKEQIKQFHKIRHIIQQQILDKIMLKIKKLKRWKNNDYDVVKMVTNLHEIFGGNDWISLAQRIQNPQTFIELISYLIKNNSFRSHYGSRDSTSLFKKILRILEKQYQCLQNENNPQSQQIQPARLSNFKQNILEFKIRLLSLLCQLKRKANKYRKVVEETVIDSAQITQFINYINQNNKTNLVKCLLHLKSIEIQQIINSIFSSKIIEENQTYRLQYRQQTRIKKQFMNQELFKYLLEQIFIKTQLSYYQSQSYLQKQDRIYLKMTPNKKNSLFISSFALSLAEQEQNEEGLQNLKQEGLIQMHSLNIYISAILDALYTSKTVFVLKEFDSFVQIDQIAKEKLILICLEHFNQNIRNIIKWKSSFSSILRNETFINKVTLLFRHMQNKSSDDIVNIFILIIKILDFILFEGTQDIQILNNKEFLDSFSKLLAKFSQNEKITEIMKFLGKYLINFITFGMDISSIDLKKTHYNSFQKFLKQPQHHQYIHQIDKTKMYINNFSQCSTLFAEFSVEKLKQIEQSFKNNPSMFEKQKSQTLQLQNQNNTDTFLKLVRFLYNYKIVITPDLLSAITNIFKNYGYMFPVYHFQQKTYEQLTYVGFNIKEQVQSALEQYDAFINVDLFLQVSPQEYLLKLQAQNQYLKKFGVLNGYLQLLLRLSIGKKEQLSPEKSVLMTKLYFKLQIIQARIYRFLINHVFALPTQQLEDYLKIFKQNTAGDSQVTQSLYRSVRDRMDKVESYIRQKISDAKLNNKYLILKEYGSQLSQIMKMQSNWDAYSYSVNSGTFMTQLNRNNHLGFLNIQVNFDTIMNVIKHLWNRNYSDDQPNQYERLVLGKNIAQFILKKRSQNLDALSEFSIVLSRFFSDFIKNSLLKMLFSFDYSESFEQQNNHKQVIVNNKIYQGKINIEKIKDACNKHVMIKVLKIMKESSQNTGICLKIIEKMTSQGFQKRRRPRRFRGLNAPQQTIQIKQAEYQTNLPENYLYEPIDLQNIETSLQLQLQILNEIFKIRYFKRPTQTIKIYDNFIKKFKSANDKLIRKQKDARIIFEDFRNNLKSEKINQIQFQYNLQWIAYFITEKERSIKPSELFTTQFIHLFIGKVMKIIQIYEEKKENHKNILLTACTIISHLIPLNFPENDDNFKKYLKTLMAVVERISKILDLKNITINSYQQITLKLIKNNVLDYDFLIKAYIDKCFLNGNYKSLKLQNILKLMLKNQKLQKIEMEADIKAHFLKIQQNIIDNDSKYLTSRLESFVNAFKDKYSHNLQGFKQVAQLFIRKSAEKKASQSQSQICFYFDRKHKLWFSQYAQKPFLGYQPHHLIKYIIKKLLQKPQLKEQNKQLSQQAIDQYTNSSMSIIQEIVYDHPMLLPYIMLEQYRQGQTNQTVLQIFMNKITSKKKQGRLRKYFDFIFKLLLDHSIIVGNTNKSIFFSEYIIYKLIKILTNQTFSTQNLLLILYLTQIKRFNHLCLYKLNKGSLSLKQTLENKFIDLNQLDNSAEEKKNAIIITQILFYLYKYEEIYNFRHCYEIKSEQTQIVNQFSQSIIPFKAIFFDENEDINFKRNDVILSNNNHDSIPPWKQCEVCLEQIYEQYKIGEMFILINQSKAENQVLEILQLFQQITLTDFSILDYQQKEQTTKKQILSRKYMLAVQKNSIFQRRFIRIVQSLMNSQESEDQFMENLLRRQLGLGDQEERRAYRGGRGGRQRGGRGNRPNRFQSRYAPEQISSPTKQSHQQASSKAIQLLKNIPEKQQQPQMNLPTMNRTYSYKMAQNKSKLQQRQTQQLNNLIFHINDYRNDIEDNCKELKLNQLNNFKTFHQKKEFLEKQLAVIQFQHLLQYQDQDLFHVVKNFQRSNRIHYIQNIQHYKGMISIARQRNSELELHKKKSNQSVDSDFIPTINQTIDALYYQNLKKGLQRKQTFKSSSSERSFNEIQEFQQCNQLMPNMQPLTQNRFPFYSQKFVLQLIKSLYQYSNRFISNYVLIPMLQNKRLQDKLINTLLVIIRNPLNNQYFPKQVKKWEKAQSSWISIQKSQAKQFICKKVIKIFDWVRHFCFYKNTEFLRSQIGYDGLFNVVLTPRIQYQNFQHEKYHQPYIQVIDHALDYNHHLAASLLMNCTQLPQYILQKIIKVIKNPAMPQNARNRRKRPRQNYIHHGMNQYIRDHQKNAICEVLFKSLKNLSSNKQFKKMFFEEFKPQISYPSFKVLSELLQTDLYTKKQLNHYHKMILQKCKNSKARHLEQYIFLNKIFLIYSDTDLIQFQQLANYQDLHSKVLKNLNENNQKISKEPISKLLNHKNLLNFKIKQDFYYNDVNPNVNNEFIDFDRMEEISAYSNEGYFYSAIKYLRDKPNQFWKKKYRMKMYNNENQLVHNAGPGPVWQWYTTLTKQMMLLDHALFELTPGYVYFFSKDSSANQNHLQYLQFIGKIVGLALTRDKFYITPELSILVYKLLLDEQIQFKDVQLHYQKGYIKQLERKFENMRLSSDDVQQYDFRFVSQRTKLLAQTLFKKQEIVVNKKNQTDRFETFIVGQLKTGGANIVVTKDNLEEYIELMMKNITNSIIDGLELQIKAFKNGVNCVVKLEKLKIFNARELQLVVEGIKPINLQQFKANIHFNCPIEQHPIKQWFCQFVQGLQQSKRDSFFQFWTSSPKIHPDGFGANQMRVIVDPEMKPDQLAYAGTCGGYLKIPLYTTKQILKERLNNIIRLFQEGFFQIKD